MSDSLAKAWDDQKAETLAALDDPQVGDRFQEMYSFWMFVVHVDGEHVATAEHGAPCTFPDDAKLRHFATRAEFREAYKYDAHSGAWVMLAGRGHDVDGWYEQLLLEYPVPAGVPRSVPREPHDPEAVRRVAEHLARRFTADGLGHMPLAEREERAKALLDALGEHGFEIALRAGTRVVR